MGALFLAGCAGESGEDDLGAGADAVSARDPVIDQARRERRIGEEPTGYLGIVDEGAATRELRAHVSHINIRRRALYTEWSDRRRTTVSEVARSTACILFRERVELGEAYRTEEGPWAVHTEDAPVVIPTHCR